MMCQIVVQGLTYIPLDSSWMLSGVEVGLTRKCHAMSFLRQRLYADNMKVCDVIE